MADRFPADPNVPAITTRMREEQAGVPSRNAGHTPHPVVLPSAATPRPADPSKK